ncbi:MAG: hypothetical protein J5725_06480 [Bacteroidales bacterium]|nr:hypothetical protein [Bacteroidales bacterium]
MKNKIRVLGQEYKIILDSSETNPKLEDNYGYLEPYSKKIVIDNSIDQDNGKTVVEGIDRFVNKIYRHEILHAFFQESGIRYKYSKDEEEFIVAWIAVQFPKMKKIFEELGVDQ